MPAALSGIRRALRAVVAVRLIFCPNDRRKAETGLASSLGDGDEDDGRTARAATGTTDERRTDLSEVTCSALHECLHPPERGSKPPFRRLSIRFVRHSPNMPR